VEVKRKKDHKNVNEKGLKRKAQVFGEPGRVSTSEQRATTANERPIQSVAQDSEFMTVAAEIKSHIESHLDLARERGNDDTKRYVLTDGRLVDLAIGYQKFRIDATDGVKRRNEKTLKELKQNLENKTINNDELDDTIQIVRRSLIN